MLRQRPTTITLTADDIAAFEETRQRRNWAQKPQAAEQKATATEMSTATVEANSGPRTTEANQARSSRTREERILGVASGRS